MKTTVSFKIIGRKKLGLRPRLKTIVKEAWNEHIKLAIATATNIENVKLLIEATLGIDIHDLFTGVVGSEMVKEKNIPKKYTRLYYLSLISTQTVALL